MDPKPILFVAGLGRCGTTMMMTMLDRGGFPVCGPAPAYEIDAMGVAGRVDPDWLRRQSGRAVKWINPLVSLVSRNDLPIRPVILHMDRDTDAMARSQLKLLQWSGTPSGLGRRAVRGFARSIDRDKLTLAARLPHLGTVHRLAFRDVLADPAFAALQLAAIVETVFAVGFDHHAAAAVVVSRPPSCAPDMAIEEALIRSHAMGRFA